MLMRLSGLRVFGIREGLILLLFCAQSLAWGNVSLKPTSAVDVSTPPLLIMQQAANVVKKQCFILIHHDTYHYEQCIQQAVNQPNNTIDQRIGMLYFGTAGALNSYRMSMLRSDYSAWTFAKQLKQQLKKSHIPLNTLCPIVEGDCAARHAMIEALLKKGRPPAIVPVEDQQ